MLIIFHNMNPLLGQMNKYPEKKDEKRKIWTTMMLFFSVLPVDNNKQKRHYVKWSWQKYFVKDFKLFCMKMSLSIWSIYMNKREDDLHPKIESSPMGYVKVPFYQGNYIKEMTS